MLIRFDSGCYRSRSLANCVGVWNERSLHLVPPMLSTLLSYTNYELPRISSLAPFLYLCCMPSFMAGAAAIPLEGLSEGKVTRVECTTSTSFKPFTIEVYHSWSPLGVERFLELVNDDFFTDVALFRCVKGFLCQFGISPDPNSPKKKYWQNQGPIDDDPTLGIPFQRGTLSFAGSGPNSRSTQLFITFADLPHLGKSPWETPLGVVTVGMETLIDTLYTGYGDQVPFNDAGVKQHILQNRGNAYLREEFPLISYFKECAVVGESHQAEAAITMEETDGEALRELLRPPLEVSSFDKPRSVSQSARMESGDVKRTGGFIWAYVFAAIVLAFGLWTWNSKRGVRARRIRRQHMIEP